jgi:Trypsin-like peptidase domain
MAPSGLDQRRLALVVCTLQGARPTKVGTGYFVTRDLVLTAAHGVPAAGVAKLEVRTEADARWRPAKAEAVWRDDALDAALLRVDEPIADAEPVQWLREAITQDVGWGSSGYPLAGTVEADGTLLWTTVGLRGTLYRGGGGGQGPKRLDLGVRDPPKPDRWAGASGAPVFVEGQLAGLIVEVPEDFSGGRLSGVPAAALLGHPGFVLALSDLWDAATPLPTRPWVLVVQSEAEPTLLATWVEGVLQKPAALEAAIGQAVHPLPLRVNIADAVQSPRHWLRLVQMLCAAPIAVFDATGFEPAVMLALGVRAVVRRGVTVTSTAEVLDADELLALPFNIKETKLLCHGDAFEPKDPRHPLNALAAAITKGWQELHTQPRYLDLPAYDGVRCPYPSTFVDDPGAVAQMLVLCPFQAFQSNWLALSNALTRRYPTRVAARMLDVASPRLVGQALYESIRWSRTCIVDWTGWRPNVMFELGVRLACSDLAPVNLIDQRDPVAQGLEPTGQKSRLLGLFQPTAYHGRPEKDAGLKAANDRAFTQAFNLHDQLDRQSPPPLPASALPYDATFQTCQQGFDFLQDRITVKPHEELRRSIQEPFGPDPQKEGRAPILFSANPAYSEALALSVRERWIAAWYYVSRRYPQASWAADTALRAELRKLANQVLLYGPRKDDPDPQMQELLKELTMAVLKLRKLESAAAPGSAP